MDDEKYESILGGEVEKTPEMLIAEPAGSAYTGGFWSQHKVTVIVAALLAVLIGALVWIAVTKEHYDFTLAVYSGRKMDILEKDVMGSFFSQFAEDSDSSGVKSVCIDAYILDENDIDSLPGAALIESDYEQHVRCLYFTTENAYEYITGLHDDMFECFDDCGEWIPIKNTSLALAMSEYGLDYGDMGFCLLHAGGDEYAAAKNFLSSLKAAYPDVFGIETSPTDSVSTADI